MNARLATQFPSSIPFLDVVLQGAAFGSLVAGVVLVRARGRQLRIKPWAVTAAWSTLGALLAVGYVAVSLLL